MDSSKTTALRKGVPLGAALLSIAFLSAGCVTNAGQNPGLIAPKVAEPSPVNLELRDLPIPEERIAVAVYGFDDLTGQYKERDTVQSLSRAVSQGASAMLIQALHQAGRRSWFSVIERAALSDLLRERQIVTEMRRIYNNDTDTSADELPPLILAPIIISGGVIGFDTNNLTGGAGARFLGIGGDVKYQQDTVTVALRAISTKTGEVLASVMTNKSIASFAIQGGVFRFIELDELLDAEAGITSNEPGQVALQQAIDKAVYALIIEGSMLDIWRFKDPTVQSAVIAEYAQKNYRPGDLPLALDGIDTIETASPTSISQIGSGVVSSTVAAPKPPTYSPDEEPLG